MTEGLDPIEPAVHWDPSPAERSYFRDKQSGQLGWLVRRDGRDCIKLDRSAQDLIQPLNGNWVPEEDHRPLNVSHFAQVAFVADQTLCRHLGLQADARKGWADLRDDDRIAWMRNGPPSLMKHPLRADLYRAIKDVLGRHCQ